MKFLLNTFGDQLFNIKTLTIFSELLNDLADQARLKNQSGCLKNSLIGGSQILKC